MKNYRRPFVAVLVINILLVLALALAWWRWRGATPAGVQGMEPAAHAVSAASIGEGPSGAEPGERKRRRRVCARAAACLNAPSFIRPAIFTQYTCGICAECFKMRSPSTPSLVSSTRPDVA